jgi:hypothetical protein
LVGHLPGTLAEILVGAWRGVQAGVAGPMKFRFVVQPLVAAIVAVRAGVRDARQARPPFLWALLVDRGHRGDHLSRGVRDIGKVFCVAFAVDVVLQLVVRHGIVPLQSSMVAVLLAVVPYLLLCGPMNRLARRRAQDVRRKPAIDRGHSQV